MLDANQMEGEKNKATHQNETILFSNDKIALENDLYVSQKT